MRMLVPAALCSLLWLACDGAEPAREPPVTMTKEEARERVSEVREAIRARGQDPERFVWTVEPMPMARRAR